MSKLQISKNLELPLDWITLATVVYGARGSGKTSLGRVFAEEAHAAGQRFCAIDLKGDWYGLKSTADGKGEGIPVVVFGGDHADLPLEEGAGAFVASTVAELEQSVVLDFENFSKGKQIRFLAEFFARLYDANREPLLLLMDECQRYAPQRPIDPDAAKCLGAVEDLVKLGRKHGIGPVLFTQRGSGLNKEVSELCDLLVAFRTPGPLDQDRVKDWLDANTTKAQRELVMGQLSGLPTGTAVFASGHPDLKLFGVYAVRRPRTFDSSATPKVGQRRVEPKKLAKPDLEALKAKMAEAIERAKADDPKALRVRVAELERELRVQQGKADVFDEMAFNALAGSIRRLFDGISICASAARDSTAEELEKFRKARTNGDSRKPRPEPEKPQGKERGAVPTPARRVGADPSLTTAERALLTAFAQQARPLSSAQAAIIAGYRPTSGGVAGALAKLRSAGYIDGAGANITISDSGLHALGDFDPLPRGKALAEHWYRQLNKAEGEILKVVVEAYPDGVTPARAADACGYSRTSGGVAGAVAKLRKLELVHNDGGAMVADERLVG